MKRKTEPAKENNKQALPVNVLCMGEQNKSDKSVYIRQDIYKKIHKFTENKTVNESGGILLGTVVDEFNKTNIIISGFIEAKYCEATPTTLKFTHETWEYIYKIQEKKFDGLKILGWIHTHPDFGVFLSEYDLFIQNNFFKEDYQIAHVVDPIRLEEGIYYWNNSNIERASGFFIYDKPGRQIVIEEENDDDYEEIGFVPKASYIKDILLIILCLINVFMMVMIIDLYGRVAALNNNNTQIVNAMNENFSKIQEVFKQIETGENTTEEMTQEPVSDEGSSQETDTKAQNETGNTLSQSESSTEGVD